MKVLHDSLSNMYPFLWMFRHHLIISFVVTIFLRLIWRLAPRFALTFRPRPGLRPRFGLGSRFAAADTSATGMATSGATAGSAPAGGTGP